MSVVLNQNGISRQLVDKVVPSCFAAETVPRAFATQNNVLWHKLPEEKRRWGFFTLPVAN